ncbi:uncharacterized protein NFIA_041570 [Aspergillus fischeri NRRL 181]|uniref:LysM domain-containing protein n=1 Tax=Neosartorya fischeri (strain ATCC 1020 / DSM 3700 / CBS 544.65 / FGSC A1164 / JCM 1740 / NRRL 181 / WB 181) TaxID=331117 RepID=A1D0Q9_NEOFI|nr:uncharacterized protein NFIA_041570 [Aspergillus fischeri NRRL 181]EAW24579.1 hypothetical protein NFIA_041570 [Aspergillus fischeri NRRL 181]
MAATHNITLTQFLSWNPSIDPICANWANQIGHVICVGNPVGYLEPTDAYATSATVTTPVAVPTNAMNGSQSYCAQWYNVSAGDYCSMTAVKYGITLNDFYFLNPEIDANCTNLWADVYYGMSDSNTTTSISTTVPTSSSATSTGPPGPTQTGVVANCQQWYVARTGDTCYDIAATYGITLDQFYAWNPAVGSDCSGLRASYAYCVMTPATSSTTIPATSITTSATPPAATQAGIPSNCNAYAVTESGDGCQVFVDRNGITLAELYEWNPVLNKDCENFWLGEAYCIGVSS